MTHLRRQTNPYSQIEAQVERYLLQCVELLGGMCPKFVDPARRGAPDRLVLLPGHPTYYVELKRPRGGRLPSHQIRYHEKIRAAGQQVWVLHSKQEIDEFLTAIQAA